MCTIVSTHIGPDYKAATKGSLPSYVDEASGMRVYLIDFGSTQAYGYAATLVDITTGRDGLFVCVSQDLPQERRAAVVHSLIVSWARKVDDTAANGGTDFSAVTA